MYIIYVDREKNLHHVQRSDKLFSNALLKWIKEILVVCGSEEMKKKII